VKQDVKQLEKDYAFQKKGKRYKTKYFGALKQLFGEIEHDKDCQVSGEGSSQTGRKTGTDQVR
jgi:hypothetical protein